MTRLFAAMALLLSLASCVYSGYYYDYGYFAPAPPVAAVVMAPPPPPPPVIVTAPVRPAPVVVRPVVVAPRPVHHEHHDRAGHPGHPQGQHHPGNGGPMFSDNGHRPQGRK